MEIHLRGCGGFESRIVGLILNYNMPRLNLTNDFTFYNDEDFFYQYDNVVEDCALPFRESFRTRELLAQRWDFMDHRGGVRIKGVVIWKYADLVIKNNIGKNYDNAFSYYTRKTKNVCDSKYWWNNKFNSRYVDYIVDKEGNIQRNENIRTNLRRIKGSSKTPYTFKSYDYEVKSFDIIHGNEIDPYSMWYSKRLVIEMVVEGYYIENVIPGSKLEKKLNREKNQKRKQLQRLANSVPKEYCYKTKQEIIERINKEVELQRLRKRGFDENSFRGEEYHGRKKNKKK